MTHVHYKRNDQEINYHKSDNYYESNDYYRPDTKLLKDIFEKLRVEYGSVIPTIVLRETVCQIAINDIDNILSPKLSNSFFHSRWKTIVDIISTNNEFSDNVYITDKERSDLNNIFGFDKLFELSNTYFICH